MVEIRIFQEELAVESLNHTIASLSDTPESVSHDGEPDIQPELVILDMAVPGVVRES